MTGEYAEFQKVQDLLSKEEKPKKQSFRFSGLMRCGHCGCMITAERKTIKLKDGSRKEHVYYHCTNARGNCGVKSVQEKKVTTFLSELVVNLEILPEFAQWGDEVITLWRTEATIQRKSAEHSQQQRLDELGDRLDELLDMRARKLTDDAEYLKKKQLLLNQKNAVIEDILTTASETEAVIDEVEFGLNFIRNAPAQFRTGSEEERLDLLKTFGTRYVLKDGLIQVEIRNVFRLIREGYEKALANMEILESAIIGSDKKKNAMNESLRSFWWAIQNAPFGRSGNPRFP